MFHGQPVLSRREEGPELEVHLALGNGGGPVGNAVNVDGDVADVG